MPAARTKRPGRPRCRDQGGAGGRGAVALGVRASGREGEEEEPGWGGVGRRGGAALVGEVWPGDKAARSRVWVARGG